MDSIMNPLTNDESKKTQTISEIIPFENSEFGQVRTVTKDNEPMFCLMDICKALGMKNATMVASRLEEDEVTKLNLGSKNGETNFVSESGLYAVILRSDKPNAKKFRKWVTSEVLPSIRKHGIYATDNVIDNILNNPDFGIELLTKLKEERKARVEAEKRNAILMHVNKTYTMTEIAKELNMKSAVALNKKLAEKKIQYKVNGVWVMYSDYSNLGYEDIKQEVLDNGKVVYHRRITQSGREFILGLFA